MKICYKDIISFLQHKITRSLLMGIPVTFMLGIMTLFYVVVPVESWLKQEVYSSEFIRNCMIVIISIWLLTSCYATYMLYIVNFRRRTSFIMIILLWFLAIMLFILLIFTSNPLLNSLQSGMSNSGANFTYGPNPTEQEIEEFKEQGYTGIITLLNPAIPFERIVLNRELEIGKKIGMKINSFPMIPWISKNKTALEQIAAFVKNNKGKYYVHCYLGKHRVEMARLVIEETLFNSQGVSINIYPDKLERGSLYYYQNSQVVIGPYPTDEEWVNYIVRSKIAIICSTLDSRNPFNTSLIAKETKICKELGLKFIQVPLHDGMTRYAIQQIERTISEYHGKIYIHNYFVDNNMKKLTDYLYSSRKNEYLKKVSEKTANSRLYGVIKSEVPASIGNENTEYITNRLTIGGIPSNLELKKLKEAGFYQFILISKRDKLLDEKINDTKEMIEKENLLFNVVPFSEEYLSQINTDILKDGKPVFLMIPTRAQYQIKFELLQTLLNN